MTFYRKICSIIPHFAVLISLIFLILHCVFLIINNLGNKENWGLFLEAIAIWIPLAAYLHDIERDIGDEDNFVNRIKAFLLGILGIILLAIPFILISFSNLKKDITTNLKGIVKYDYIETVVDSSVNSINIVWQDQPICMNNLNTDQIRFEIIRLKDSLLRKYSSKFFDDSTTSFKVLMSKSDSVLSAGETIETIVNTELIKQQLLIQINKIIQLGGNEEKRNTLFKTIPSLSTNTLLVETDKDGKSQHLNSYLALIDDINKIRCIKRITFENGKITKVYCTRL